MVISYHIFSNINLTEDIIVHKVRLTLQGALKVTNNYRRSRKKIQKKSTGVSLKFKLFKQTSIKICFVVLDFRLFVSYNEQCSSKATSRHMHNYLTHVEGSKAFHKLKGHFKAYAKILYKLLNTL